MEKDVQQKDEAEDGEVPGARSKEAGHAEERDGSEGDGEREIALAAAEQVIESGGDGDERAAGIELDPGEVAEGIELGDDELEEPAIGLPGLVEGGAGEGVGARDSVVREDPVAGRKMPPDIGVGDGGFVEGDPGSRDEEYEQDEALRDLLAARRGA